MADRVDDDLVSQDLVEYKEGIGRRRKTTNGWVLGSDAYVWMRHQQLDNVLYASLDALELPAATLQQCSREWNRDRQALDGYSGASQPVLGPDGADPFFCCKLAACRGLFRGRNRGPFFIGERYGRRIIGTGKLKDHPGNIILGVRREA